MCKTLILFLCILALTLPGEPSTSPVKKHVLANGLTILSKESRTNDIVAVQIYLRMGTRYETDEQAGLSTLLQSLLLKGTTTRTAAQIATEIESVGGRISTSAGRDYASVSLLIIREGLDVGLDILFDILQNATFPEDEVEQEKELLLRQIKARRDQLLASTFDLFQETYYQSHPYHKPRLGYPETVKQFNRKSVLDFYKTYYVPNNLLFSLVGNFDSPEVIERIKRQFGRLPRRDLPSHSETILSPASQPKEDSLERESQTAWIVLGFSAPSITHPDFAAMQVLNAITSGSMDSRLFVELRDKRGLAYQIGSLYVPRSGPSFYATYIGTKPDQFELARQGILTEIERIKTELVESEELKRTKTYLRGTFIMSQESNAGQASLMGQYELLGLGYQFVNEYPKLITLVAEEDILRVAQRYLGHYTLGAILPEKPDVKESIKDN